MKTFHNILFNSLAVSIANNTVWFALTFWAYLETKSVIATSLVGGIYLIASTASSMWFGSLVDHNRKKIIMMASSIASLVFYTISMIVLLITPASQFSSITSPMLWIIICLLMFGVLPGNIRSIAVPTLVTHLIPEEERDKANGLSGMMFGISFLCTSVISGFLLAHTGMFGVLCVVITITVISIVHLASTSLQEKEIIHTEEHDKKVDIAGTVKVILGVPGLMSLLFFATFNNFLGGVFMALMDAYGLSLVSVETWGLLWGAVSLGFIIGGSYVAKRGVGKKPLRSLFLVNIAAWSLCIIFPMQAWILLLTFCMLLNMSIMPIAEAAEQTVLQKVVPPERQGRVFGFAQSVEWAATPLTAFLIGPIAELFFIPYMSEGGQGAVLIGSWFGVGPDRGMALVFIVAGIIGLLITILAFQSRAYRLLSAKYAE